MTEENLVLNPTSGRPLLGILDDRNRMLFRYQLGPDQPPVAWAKIAACDSAASGGLNEWAALNRNWANSSHPLIDGRRCYAKGVCQCFLATEDGAGSLNSVHGGIIRRRLTHVNRNCLSRSHRKELGNA